MLCWLSSTKHVKLLQLYVCNTDKVSYNAKTGFNKKNLNCMDAKTCTKEYSCDTKMIVGIVLVYLYITCKQIISLNCAIGILRFLIVA